MSDNTTSKIDIENRIDDWMERVSKLYTFIKESLSSVPSYSTKENSEVTMYEELMQKYQLPPRQLKVLDIYHEGHIVATLKPIGLWIIGANGRVDFLSKEGAVLLVDKSEKLHSSNWTCYTKTKKDKGEPFDKEHFLQFLGVHSNDPI